MWTTKGACPPEQVGCPPEQGGDSSNLNIIPHHDHHSETWTRVFYVLYTVLSVFAIKSRCTIFVCITVMDVLTYAYKVLHSTVTIDYTYTKHNIKAIAYGVDNYHHGRFL